MAYPEFPWRLKSEGLVFVSLFLIDAQRARGVVPEQLQVVTPLPGKTLGGLYLVKYGPGSEVEYNELIACPALVKYEGHYGFWVSNIWVDNPAATVGVREALGLEKDIISFDRNEQERTVTLFKADSNILKLSYGERQYWLFRMHLVGPAFRMLDSGDIIRVCGGWRLEPGVTQVKLEIPHDSPLASLGFVKPLISGCGKNADAELFRTLGRWKRSF